MYRCISAAIRGRIVDAVRTVPQLTVYIYGLLLFCFYSLVSFDPFSPFRSGVWCRLGWARRHLHFVVTLSLSWPVVLVFLLSLLSKAYCTPSYHGLEHFRAFECDLSTGGSEGRGRGPSPGLCACRDNFDWHNERPCQI